MSGACPGEGDPSAYPLLVSPLAVGPLTLRNRIVMGAMHTRIELLDRPVERLAAFYRERARGETALILTGGVAPNAEGRMEEGAPVLADRAPLAAHRAVTAAVHAEDGRIALQILHAGRYARHALCVGPSARRSPITPFAPRPLDTAQVRATVADYARCAALAREAGYDGVEVMGSEGYLINQFAAPCTNDRADEYGGGFDNRIRLAVDIVRAIRRAAGADFLLIYRISAIDLVPGGMTASETARLARAVEEAGAHAIDTGIGWHESRVPTIAAAVPRAAWAFAARHVKQAVHVPVIASNRINTPEVAEALLAAGDADLVSLARPLLADPAFARKARRGEARRINSCIACNQACLDRIFSGRSASCLVNPQAGREIEFDAPPAARAKSIAVVGAGPAGMRCAIDAARRGHRVHLFEADAEPGGQLRLARAVPGKSEFDEMLRYFRQALDDACVALTLGHRVDAAALAAGGFDEIVIATGAVPRVPAIAGIDHSKVLSYADVLLGRRPAGRRVAIIGAGGIGFDVAAFLLLDPRESLSPERFLRAWEIGVSGGAPATASRDVFLLQRSPGRSGARLGRTTGWILKAALRRAGLQMLDDVRYVAIDDAGLHCSVAGRERVLDVDSVIVCAGQEPERTLADGLAARGIACHRIGGAQAAAELDAARAIEQAARLAASL
ncbi:NADPH-dependent 2,4-dienoyl-CoA reductase [Pigmentiphaga soli]|uniref:NADPH-dependent 2,4-dienoyl-CoA reductase n=1 Tax=Pigmentiphaga soli TaxID=1007095 RepID=A0ABP8GE20_9BURK